MYLIVGLGNPDSVYKNTFHNIGFMAVDRFAEKIGAKFTKKECKAVTAHTFVGDEKVIIAKPQTYMNLSGESVLSLTAKYKINQDEFFIVYDDVDLELGALRIRESGSAGTHNGMKNVIANIGTQDFNRLRIGAGRGDNEQMDLKDFVLSKISAVDFAILSKTFDSAAAALTEFCKGVPVQKIMQKYNAKNQCV